MKTRLGFVSNSSSCSFICKICGKEESGYSWDEIPKSGEMGRCIRGHLLCRGHFSFKKTKVNLEKIPSKFCPLCKIEGSTLKEYLFKHQDLTVKEVLAELYFEEFEDSILRS